MPVCTMPRKKMEAVLRRVNAGGYRRMKGSPRAMFRQWERRRQSPGEPFRFIRKNTMPAPWQSPPARARTLPRAIPGASPGAEAAPQEERHPRGNAEEAQPVPLFRTLPGEEPAQKNRPHRRGVEEEDGVGLDGELARRHIADP